MGMLILKCPTTGQEFSTGIHLEEDSFKELPETVSEAHCPHCGLSHRWRTHEARYSDKIAPGGAP